MTIMIAYHSNSWYYTQCPTGYSLCIMIKVVATPRSNRNAIQINLVDNAEADEFAWVFGNATSQGLQGNGEGPSAR